MLWLLKLFAVATLFLSSCIETSATSTTVAALEGVLVPEFDTPATPGTPPIMKLDPVLQFHLKERDQTAMVALYIQSRAPVLTAGMVRQAGGEVNTTAGDVLTARLAPQRFIDVAEGAEVDRMEAAARVGYRLDQARAHTRTDAVHQGMTPLSQAYDGTGVVVAVIDSGLDLAHPAFRDARDQTRVLALWDQSGMGNPPMGRDYGAVCLEATINAGSCAHAENASHGTHVAGIAAGSPVMGVNFGGMAPGSSIVYIDAGTDDDSTEAFTTEVCDAVSFAIDAAGNRPMVVNMSLGEHSGPHDGSSLAARCLDNLVRGQAGKILVAAAGNEGQGSGRPDPFDTGATVDTFVHATGMATANPDRLFFVTHTNDRLTAVQTDVNLYAYAGVTLSVRLGIRDANGNEAMTDPLVTDGGAPRVLTLGGVEYGPFALLRQTQPDRQIRYGVRTGDMNDDNLEARIVLFLEITGAGEWHAWLDTTSTGGFIQAGGTRATIDNTFAIGYPAIASEVITVAALGNRSTWPTADGQGSSDNTTVVNGLSGFSSRGPSRNPMTNGFKPDISAPGEHVVSTLSQDSMETEITPNRVAFGARGMLGSYFEETGTSMASPAVAGIVALMLQANPQLNTGSVRSILRNTANTTGIAATLPNIGWGYGRVDALAAVASAASMTGGAGNDAGVPDVGPPDGGSNNGGTSDAGTAIGGNDATVPGPSPAPAAAVDEGCRGAAPGDLSSAWFLALGAAVLWRRRRR